MFRASLCGIMIFIGVASASAQEGGKIPADIAEHMTEGLNNAAKVAVANVRRKQAEHRLDVLSKNDLTKDPNYSPPGAPKVPSSCATVAPAVIVADCKGCYEPAVTSLNHTRARLERLRTFYQATHEYAKASMEEMDAWAELAGHGAGVQAINEKLKIELSLKDFDKSYDNKYDELMETLKASLGEISRCEDLIFGVKDWYDRYGFIYYQFMADRYRRD